MAALTEDTAVVVTLPYSVAGVCLARRRLRRGLDHLPAAADAFATALGGRGLAIVESVSGRWWVERGAEGTTVFAAIGPG